MLLWKLLLLPWCLTDKVPARLTTQSKLQQAGFALQIPASKCPWVSLSLKHTAVFNKELSSFAIQMLSP